MTETHDQKAATEAAVDGTAEARQSYTGSRLTASQFDEAWAVASVLHREIARSGSFAAKLTDYSHAFARGERFDTARGEIILRDMFTARYGESMNKMREGLLAREAALQAKGNEDALEQAKRVTALIQDGDTMPFYQAYDRASVEMAQTHGITETAAKELMKDAYKKAEGRDLYTDGKALEAEYHHPIRDAAYQARHAERQKQQSPDRTGPTR